MPFSLSFPLCVFSRDNSRNKKKKANIHIFLFVFFSFILMSGCSKYHVIPEHLEDQVDKNISFARIYNAPDAYRGKLVVVGGKILGLKQQNNVSRLEVLQLPLSEQYLPQNQPARGQGRFLALCSGKDPLDPDIVRPDTAVTIVGEVIGSSTAIGEQDETQMPVLAIKDLTIWDKHRLEGSIVEARGWYYSSVYMPYGYHSYQWSNCQSSH